jgi:hypothetical protein
MHQITHPYRSARSAYNFSVKRANSNVVNWTAEQVFAAAVAADQVNDGYRKYEEKNLETGVVRKANKTVIQDLLRDGTQFTAEQIAQGNQIRQHYQGLLFDQMAGDLKDFLATVLRVSTRESVASNDWLDLAVIASLPNSYRRDIARLEAEAARKQIAESSKLHGQPGDRVRGEFVIVQCRWSQKWNRWTVNATLNDNLFFFFHNKELTVGSTVQLAGTVKCHRDGNTTQLNRVKIS